MNTRRVVIGSLLLGLGVAHVWADTDSSTTESAPSSTEHPSSGSTEHAPPPPASSEGGASQSAAASSTSAESTTPASTPAAFAVPAPNGLVSVDFKDADVRQVLRVIALKSGVDIVAGADVEGLVTIKLTSVPWEQALDIILRTYGLTYERKNNIVRVMTIQALEQEALATEVFPLNYAKAKEVPDIINEMLSERGKVKFDERTNTVIVTDIPTALFQIKEVVRRLDQRTPQVLIETRIIETKLEKDENLGIDWSDSVSLAQTATVFPSTFPWKAQGTLGSLGDEFVSRPFGRVAGPTGLLTSTSTGAIGIGTLTGPALSLTLNALKKRQDTKVLSNPTLAVLNNQQARIHIGEDFPVPNFSVDPSTGKTTVSGFQTKTTGTILTVTPHVNQSQEIVVDLKPEIVAVGTNASFNVGGSETVSLPRFSTQTVVTQVRIKDGETIAIGGLVKEIELVEEVKVPFLGELPLIGALFSSTHRSSGSGNPTLKQDLLIFLTVSLSAEDRPQRAIAANPQ